MPRHKGPEKKQISSRLSVPTMANLRQEAAKQGITAQTYVAHLLEAMFGERAER